MKKYDINPKIARSYLEANDHNRITTIYYLLLKKFCHEGKKIVSPYILIPNPLKDKNEKNEIKNENNKSMFTQNEKIDCNRKNFDNFLKKFGKSPKANIAMQKIKKNSFESISQNADIKRADFSIDFRSIDTLKCKEKEKKELNKSSHYISSNGMLYQLSKITRSFISKFIQ